MDTALQIYIPGNSLVHRCDARVKLVLLLAISIGVFCVGHWVGLGLLAAFTAWAVIDARLDIKMLLKISIPVLAVLTFVIIFNSFVIDVAHVPAPTGLADVSAGFAAGMAPVALIGTFGFVPEGFVRGLFYVTRILIILWASFAVSFTTTSNALSGALISFMSPLRKLRFPVDDAAMVLTIAIRFIPLTAEEFMHIHAAQVSRGAGFEQGSAWKRMRSWVTVLVPLFVSMFRQADNLAIAMDARCYGAGERTRLDDARLTSASWVVLAVGVIAVVAIAFVF